ncbi:hypothetical protein C1645_760615 [Glomus cerebriforme]|uniref:Uncharacterized protein n=1 Tax=Glomus cerebriforme TaxID=658196 RepID=A0A397TGR5_9GLOM|nr:hypothetical protein C1645_760615 [Glomus cerebriforme]
MLDKLLNIINKEDPLILCYYGEILSKKKKSFDTAVSYFTRASIIDPENVYNLNKRAITHFIRKDYNKALLDLDKAIQLDTSNSIAYFYKWLIYSIEEDSHNAESVFKTCTELDVWSHLYEICKFNDNNDAELGIVNKFNMFMYRAQMIYFAENLINLDGKLCHFQENDSNR